MSRYTGHLRLMMPSCCHGHMNSMRWRCPLWHLVNTKPSGFATGRAGLRVIVANDERVHSSGCCKDLPITIGDELFTLDYFGLTLGSHEMVLGVQWLESLGPILWDFTACTIVFVRNGHRIC
jgi:hypothetical protein